MWGSSDLMPSIPRTPRASKGQMESESYNLLQLPKVTGPPVEEELSQGAVPTWGWGAGQGGDPNRQLWALPCFPSRHLSTRFCWAPADASASSLTAPCPCFQKLRQASLYPHNHTSRCQ